MLEAQLLHDNSDYWREYAKYLWVNEGLIQMKFVLQNRSGVQLSNAKLEMLVDPLDGQDYKMVPGAELPEKPKQRESRLKGLNRLSEAKSSQKFYPVVEKNGNELFCSIRFGSLLPGEDGRSLGTIAIVPLSPGKLRLRFRVLASELATPYEIEQAIECTGPVESLSFKEFKTMFC